MDFHARPGFARAGVPDDATDDLARLNHEDGFRPVQHGRGIIMRTRNNDRALLARGLIVRRRVEARAVDHEPVGSGAAALRRAQTYEPLRTRSRETKPPVR